jgi:hypothetical protein
VSAASLFSLFFNQVLARLGFHYSEHSTESAPPLHQTFNIRTLAHLSHQHPFYQSSSALLVLMMHPPSSVGSGNGMTDIQGEDSQGTSQVKTHPTDPCKNSTVRSPPSSTLTNACSLRQIIPCLRSMCLQQKLPLHYCAIS